MVVKRLLEATGIGGLAAAVGDVFLFGGDQLLDIGLFVLANVDLLLPFALRLDRVAELVEWLPKDAVQKFVTIVAVIAVLVYAYRLLKRWQETQ